MSSVVLTGDTSGSGTITVPAVAGTFTATIGSATGTHYPFTAGTAVASTSGTSIDFTSIPSWVKRVTVMYQGVSTNSTSGWLVQIGSGSVTNTGYVSGAHTTSNADYSSTAGFIVLGASVAATTYSGVVTVNLANTNSYACSGVLSPPGAAGSASVSGGWITLSGALDRIRITTVNGTDTFDAGSINILYE
jgi:hypothetical protein